MTQLTAASHAVTQSLSQLGTEAYYGLSKVVEDEEGGALQSCYDDFKDMMND